jgi:acetyl/propionyl-CoA carboxylase alpha subunit
MIKKLLIANRGEIAVRVIRAAREMGIRTVAVYSEADANQMHVALADESVLLGAPEPSESYLNMAKILDAAKQTGADSIHPGYGFLSERAEFSLACADSGLTFVGPPASAMEKLGAKIQAKQLAVSVGVPVTRGFFETGASPAQLKAAAEDIGFPVMLKASAGGGGRGMRIVRSPNAFHEELAIASDEALKAFGNGEMMVEKLIDQPRHIEVQILADTHGNIACLFERECSLQRRHQKLIEEAPSPVMSQPLWSKMRAAVVSLVQASGYFGAGTVEFMFDQTSGDFYFLEVNARLQVEHPVTEAITGLDLVQWQLRIAGGDKLTISDSLIVGDRLAIAGHSIEARIVAEDPSANFLPSIGKILAWAEPKRPGVRVDTGYAAGAEISRYYDSLIAKVIAHAATREEAIRRLEEALLDFHILGVKTNIGYILEVVRHPQFRSGDFDTGFLGREFADWKPQAHVPSELAAIAGHAGSAVRDQAVSREASTVWELSDGFRIAR